MPVRFHAEVQELLHVFRLLSTVRTAITFFRDWATFLQR